VLELRGYGGCPNKGVGFDSSGILRGHAVLMVLGRQALLELCFCIVLSTDTLKEPEIDQVRHDTFSYLKTRGPSMQR
jgi:hypothetical protein